MQLPSVVSALIERVKKKKKLIKNKICLKKLVLGAFEGPAWRTIASEMSRTVCICYEVWVCMSLTDLILIAGVYGCV